MTIGLGNGFQFESSNGGNISIIRDTELDIFGIRNGWVFWDKMYINSYNDMTIDVGGDYYVKGSIKHVNGEDIFRFNLTSRSPNGRADMKFKNLKPNAYYRLEFEGVLAECSTGMAHGKTGDNGVIQFNEVAIPDE